MCDVVKKNNCMVPMDNNFLKKSQWERATVEFNKAMDLNLSKDVFRSRCVYFELYKI